MTLYTLSALIVATAPAVYAAVPAENIVGDIQVTEDRAPIKEQDAKDIHSEFCQYNKNGNAIVDVEEIRIAIELSDALNDFYFDKLYFTNTNKQEVLGLDIDSLYSDYLYALSRDEAVILSSEEPTVTYRPSRKEVQMLQNLEYTDIQARSARVSEATITLLDLSYTK